MLMLKCRTFSRQLTGTVVKQLAGCDELCIAAACSRASWHLQTFLRF
jgi:hypothetical protein